MGLQISTLPDAGPEFDAYMSALDDKQLAKLTEALELHFNEAFGDGEGIDNEGLKALTAVRDRITACRAMKTKREKDALDAEAAEATTRQRAALQKLKQSVDGGGNGNGQATAVLEGTAVAPSADEFKEQFARALLEAVGLVSASVQVRGPDLNKHIRDMPLSAAAAHAPDPKVAPRRSEPVITAASDIPGTHPGNRLETFDELCDTMHARSRMMGVTRERPNWVTVATQERDFRYRLALDSTPEEVDEVLTAATSPEALIAAGGWCAPSEISYDFYNIVAEDGLVDVPSVGVLNRGGLRYVNSPSIASIFGAPTALWNWTEAQDVEAATSTSQVKTCFRVPCPTFAEVRAACDGLCVTVGNLVDYAYPELVRNHIRLVFAARAHRTNQQIIAAMAADSKVKTVNLSASLLPVDQDAAAFILSAVELMAEDIRYRFRMPINSVLEGVFPHWALGLFRADLANRQGVDMLAVTNAQIADWLNSRGVRAQFVYDWQGGFSTDAIGHPTTQATAWPVSAQFLIYPAGTYVRGQGLQLDLGVVRDSALNATNDHTAAWMEDCYAVVAVGHESRLVTVLTAVGGETGGSIT